MPAISNLIIFGDSMSDIGNKRETKMGMIARGLGLMRTNEVGRFSDGRNWTDFLWQWAGGRRLVTENQATSLAMTEVHRSLGPDSNQDSGFGRPFHYVNYAEGGAMGASDRPATGLGTFKDQVLRYVKEREAFALRGNTLHIIWFGLNDLVTNNRPPATMDYVVDEIGTGMRAIDMHFGAREHYYVVINLPSPVGAQRFIKANALALVAGYDKGATVFNAHLAGLTNGRYYDVGDHVTLVDMHGFVNDVNDHMERYGLVDASQPHGVRVDYGTFGEDGGDPATRKCVATSDDAHPTEAVYKLMARHVATQIKGAGYELGDLGRSRLL